MKKSVKSEENLTLTSDAAMSSTRFCKKKVETEFNKEYSGLRFRIVSCPEPMNIHQHGNGIDVSEIDLRTHALRGKY